MAQIDASENVLGKIGYVAIIYGVLSTIALYQVKKEWLTYVHSYVDSIPQKLCDTVPYCYLYGREVAVQ